MSTINVNSTLVDVIDNFENRNAVAKTIIDGEIAKARKEMPEHVKNEFEAYMASGLEDYNLCELLGCNLWEEYLRKDLTEKVISFYEKANTLFRDAMLSPADNAIVHDFFTPISLFDLFCLDAGYSSEYSCEFTNYVNEKIGDISADEYIFENKEQKFYIVARFEVHSKHAYGYNELKNRFIHRVGHKWEGASIASYSMVKTENEPYKVAITIEIKGFDPYSIKVAEDRLKFRFGPTSGRPWNACQLIECDVVGENED